MQFIIFQLVLFHSICNSKSFKQLSEGGKTTCGPDETECPNNCCPVANWFCCADGRYCAETEDKCPLANSNSFKVGMGPVNLSLFGSGFGFFNFARVGFRVFVFFLGLRIFGFGLTSGPSFFLKSYILSLIWGLVPLKVRVRWLESGKNCPGLRKKYYGLAQVLQKIARVGLGKTYSDRVLIQPIPSNSISTKLSNIYITLWW